MPIRLFLYWLSSITVLVLLYLAPDRWPIFKMAIFFLGCAVFPFFVLRAYWWEEEDAKKRAREVEGWGKRSNG